MIIINARGETAWRSASYQLDAPHCGLCLFQPERESPYGYVTPAGSHVIPAKYKSAGQFDYASGVACAVVGRGGVDQYGLINRAGQFVAPPQFMSVMLPANGLFCYRSFEANGLHGFMSLDGSLRIEPQFDAATSFSCGLASVSYPSEPGLFYYINAMGCRVAGPFAGFPSDGPSGNQYSADGLARVVEPDSHRVLFIDAVGRKVLDCPEGIAIDAFSCGLARAYQPSCKLFGFLGLDGEWVIRPKFANACAFNSGTACVQLGKHWGAIDASGAVIIPPVYNSWFGFIGRPCCGFIRLCDVKPDSPSKGKFGFVSVRGGMIRIPHMYSEATDFSEGFAVVDE